MNRAMTMMKTFLFPAAAALLLAGCAAYPAAEISRPAPAANGMVSAADPRAAEAGAAMLKVGGSATDAAIAIMLALTVVEPQSSGIGGGGFYVHATAAGEVETLDGRETAPAAADPDWFLDETGEPLPFAQAVLSGLSIGVPGNIALAAEAHERHGTLPWADLFTPAIMLARDGFTISERLREFLVRSAHRAGHQDAGRALFFGADGEPLPVGTLVHQEQLARTLERIAAHGPDAFYQGAEGAALAAAIAAATPHQGSMTAQDLAEYQALWRPAACGEYRLYRICGMGPPSSGATTVFAILKQLEHFDMGALGPASATSWHLFAESQRVAYADREIYLADADFVAVPLAGLMDGDYLASRGALISPHWRLDAVSAGTPAGAQQSRAPGVGPEESGTSHLVTVDSAGNAVSFTSTIEGPFGSGYMFGGYYLNNELTDFSFRPEADGALVANRVEGGKRPRSSMAPTVVFAPDGTLVIAIGAAGGATIPVQVAKALIGMIDWGLTAQEAIALPGLYSPADTVSVEAGSALRDLKSALEALGHSVTERPMPLKANAAQLIDGQWTGAADPRSEGIWISQPLAAAPASP